MSSFPTFSRVTEAMLSGCVLRSLQQNIRGIARDQRRISSGREFSGPIEAPLPARRTITWERWVERNEQFSANISLTSSRLSATESALDEMGELILRARQIGLQQINASATEGTRANAAVEISALVDEAVALGNRQFGDRYLFGGSQVDGAPFERVGAYVSYGGDADEPPVEIAPGMVMPGSLSGARAFGGWSTEIRGRADLDPLINEETPLRLLNGGRGVTSGEIEIRDGAGARRVIDLSGAKTVGDVIGAVNQSGFATAALNVTRTGLLLTKSGANLSILDVNGGKTATDLGIAKAGMGASIDGDDLDPRLAATTRLSLLLAGAGIDRGGFNIVNGNLSASIGLTGTETIEGLLNAVNASGTGTVARISADGRGIDILSHMAGADLFVVEGSGTTASELGLIMPEAELPLARLHGGRGVQTIDGSDLRITLGDGSSLEVDLSEADTLGDGIDLINNHPANAGLVLAEAVAGENRIRLTDLTGGPQDITVSPMNGSFAASGLGIEGTGTAGVIEGSDLAPGGIRLESAFDGFELLRSGLIASDEGQIARAIEALDLADDRVLRARAEMGGRIRRLEISERRTELETLEMKELISREGDTDLAEAIVSFQQQETVYQASLQTSARLMQQSILDFLG
ncbi:MAG: hypothetical protein ACE5GW_08265 [Planctomycetota bacterium]